MQGVYSAAPLGGGVAAIDVEYVPERDVRIEREPEPDLIIDDPFDLSVLCEGPPTAQRRQFTLGFGVRNVGEATADPFQVEVTVEPRFETLVDVNEELAPGTVATRVAAGHAVVTPATERFICLGADEPANAVAESDETNNGRCLSF